MPIVQVKLAISSTEYARYYQGVASNVVCTASDGRTIQFPAAVLRKHLTHDGVHGTFAIEFSDQNRFVQLLKLE